MAEALQYPREFFVWVDETGSDRRDHMRKFGRGFTPEHRRLLLRGPRISAVLGMSSQGILALDFTTNTMNGVKFYDYIHGQLIPCMQPFPAPHSILVVDNCSIHHTADVENELHTAGIMVLFLPPYSPDLNPCEELFSCVKYYLKDHDNILQCREYLQDILTSAF